MKGQKETKTAGKPQITLEKGLIIYAVLFVCFIGIVVLNHASIVITLMFSAVVAIAVAITFGFSYRAIEKVMVDHFAYIAVPILVALFAGFTIGEWMAGGVIPTALYYGLGIFSPRSFLVTGFLVCVIVSLLFGSAMGTIGSVGVVLLAIGTALGISAPMAIGAIVSGAYCGEKISPLSLSNNAATASVFGDVLQHSAFSARTGVVSFLIALAAFAVMGSGSGAADTAAIEAYRTGLASAFKINPLLLLPIVLLIFLMWKKVHPIPALALVGFIGLLFALLVQGYDIKTLLSVAYNGAGKIDTGIAEVNSLIQRGGFSGVLSVMALYIGACTFTTVADACGARTVVVDSLLKNARKDSQVVLITQASALVHLLGLGDAQAAEYLNGNLFVEAYKSRGLALKTLTRANCDICTSLSPLVPWTTGALFVSATLGSGYAPFCIFNLASVVIAVILAAVGRDIAKTEKK